MGSNRQLMRVMDRVEKRYTEAISQADEIQQRVNRMGIYTNPAPKKRAPGPLSKSQARKKWGSVICHYCDTTQRYNDQCTACGAPITRPKKPEQQDLGFIAPKPYLESREAEVARTILAIVIMVAAMAALLLTFVSAIE